MTPGNTCKNGAGGYFDCSKLVSDEEIAKAACESVYSTCSTGKCGKFKYYYESSDATCSCTKAVGKYEFIYANTGYTTVGMDYSGGSSDQSVTGNTLFVRKKTASGCGSNRWNLVLETLGGIF